MAKVTQTQSTLPSDGLQEPFYELTLSNMHVAAYQRDHDVIDVRWRVVDEECDVVTGTLRDFTSHTFYEFINQITPNKDPDRVLLFVKGQQISDEVIADLSSDVLDDDSFRVVSEFDFQATPEILRKALKFAVSSGAQFSHSIDKIVKTFQHYMERDNDLHEPDVNLITVHTADQKITHRHNPKRLNIPEENGQGPLSQLHWFDIDTLLPQGSLPPEAVINIIKSHVPKKIMDEEFQMVSLRGFSLDPKQPERIMRKKLLILVGERSLITLHDGPIDNVASYGAQDSIAQFRQLMLCKGNSHGDLFINSGSSLKALGPGAILLDLCTVLFREQESVIKRYQDMVDNAEYDATHRTTKKVAFTIDTGVAKNAVDYMSRRIDDATQRIQKLCSARKSKSLERIFGSLDQADIEQAENDLLRSAQRMTLFCETSTAKIKELEAHKERLMSGERDVRQYAMTLAGTLIIPALAAVELAQVPWKPIQDNPQLILAGGAIMSLLSSIGFVAYDLYRRRKLGAI